MYYIALYWTQEGRVEDAYHVIPAAGGKSLKRKSLKNNEINC